MLTRSLYCKMADCMREARTSNYLQTLCLCTLACGTCSTAPPHHDKKTLLYISQININCNFISLIHSNGKPIFLVYKVYFTLWISLMWFAWGFILNWTLKPGLYGSCLPKVPTIFISLCKCYSNFLGCQSIVVVGNQNFVCQSLLERSKWTSKEGTSEVENFLNAFAFYQRVCVPLGCFQQSNFKKCPTVD